ncbi:hypothetical protein SAMN05421813_106132 [Daejeonella rubra]|uniref:Universal stress protein family protein n=1 Tax=Daejeonella rubra TaxID=990371 RepID=A0A1G9QNS0_9SPHI|nr:hypothetical protein [Daejeonella rubra]SDM12646.1 hypothetical protein SAMN05421813_106132 [Daejeonella rubra]
MKMILLAVNALNPDKGSYEFACYLGRLSKSKVYGIFLNGSEVDEKLILIKKEGAFATHSGSEDHSDLYITKKETIKNNIHLFKEGCISNEVCNDVYSDHEVSVDDLINESRFADMIVVDAALSLGSVPSTAPSEIVKDILKKANCPVIISPLSFDGIEELIFTYNGSLSSVFAIKQFTYLFPEYFDKRVTVVQVNKDGIWPYKDKEKLKEWLKNHYSDLHFLALEGNTESELMSFLFRRENMFIVMGAYSRNALSQFFSESTAEILIKTLTQPIFISHH